jgi:hypothetical protein
MTNMSYCRFTNTAADLEDCFGHIDDDLSLEEARAKVRLLRLCVAISDSYSVEDAEADVQQIKEANGQFGVGA